MGDEVKRIAGSILAGILVTSIPLACAILFPASELWRSAAVICDWPYLLVKSVNIGRNELYRLIFFFIVNIAAWALIAYLTLLGLTKRGAR
jgi:hypothetical protein